MTNEEIRKKVLEDFQKYKKRIQLKENGEYMDYECPVCRELFDSGETDDFNLHLIMCITIALMKAEQEKERCIKNGNKLGQTNWSTYCNSITYRSQCNKEYCIAWEDCVIRKLEQERQALSEKIDKVVDEWTETYWGNVNYGMKENLKQKLKEAVRKCLTKKSEIKCWKN